MGEYVKDRLGLLDYKYMNSKAKDILEEMGQDFEPTILCGALGMGQQQMVEIGKAILINAKLIIFDEPTSSLGEKEAELLFDIIRKLKEKGIAILFVSHKLEEIFELCDLVTVMRDGKHVVTVPAQEVTKDQLISYMVGRTLNNMYPKSTCPKGEIALEVKTCRAQADTKT